MILIDPPTRHETPLRWKWWCHLVSDTSAEELHAFAAIVGLKRAWSQERPAASAHHYDIIASRRNKAIQLGAISVTRRELVLRNYDGRYARGLLLRTRPP